MELSRKERAFESRFRKKLAVWPVQSFWPGVLVSVLLTFLAASIHVLPFAPFTLSDGQNPVSAVLLALLLGMAVRNLFSSTAGLKPGTDTMVKKWLPVGIVLLGARLDFFVLIRVALQVTVGAALLIAVVIVLTHVLARWCRVQERLGLLIGVGTAICGSSAIVAVAPVVEAKEEEMAYSIGVVNLLGIVAMLLFPAAGTLVGMDAGLYGTWCGLGIHATPQVIAAGFAHPTDGQTAGEMATIVKLVRISLLGPTVFALGLWYAHRQRRRDTHVGGPIRYSKLVPGFVLLFLGMALLRTVGLLPEVTLHLKAPFPLGAGDRIVDLARLFSDAGRWVITAAMAGVGLSTEFRAMKSGGIRPLILGVLAAIGIAFLGLGVSTV